MTQEGKIHTQTADGISTIEFYHPQSNSLPGQLLVSLAGAITDADKNQSSRVIILKSTGEKAFCAGASFDELTAIKNIEEGKRFFSGFALVINAIRKSSKLVIARIQGKAVGGGVGLAAAADYALAHDSASVKLSELAVGIGPFVVGPAVERKMGLSAFSSLAINATQWQSAHWAMNHGLYTNVLATHEELDAEVMSVALRLAGSNPDAMRELKKIFWQGTEHWDELLTARAEISGTLVLSEFTRNAIAAFKSGARS
jgi:methylglutaconyl-CoA hydratase